MTDEEQEVTMASSVRNIEGIGPQAADIFESAGFFTIERLKKFDREDAKLWTAIGVRYPTDYRDRAFRRRLMTRCIDIVYRVRSAKATDFVPHEYMCPI